MRTETIKENIPAAAGTMQKGKKIPPELRKQQNDYRHEKNVVRRILRRLKEDSQFLRATSQFAFALLCCWIGMEFYLFMHWGQSGGMKPYSNRPPGVEGFLPISALISLKYWLQTGIINTIHPSGLFIFLGIVLIGIVFKKAFCSWLCPIGTISESLWLFGKKIFTTNIVLPRWLDYPLRSMKYLLLSFFAYAVYGMNAGTVRDFIYSPYNKMADVKMYLFFIHISSFALLTIIVLVLLSVVIKNFWCRYLCPYGALLGAVSLLSPFKIKREKRSCIDCELCTKACPSTIAVHTVSVVRSDECNSCFACIQACPVKNTLTMKTPVSDTSIPSWLFGALVAGVFIAVTGLAILTGHWQNSLSKDEYLKRMKNIDSPLYQHNRGEVSHYGPND